MPLIRDLAGRNLTLTGYIRGGATGNAININTGNGFIHLGPQNTSWAHIYTDRPRFIFNKDVYTSTGGFSAYSNANLFLRTNGTTRMTLRKDNGNVGIGCDPGDVQLKIYKSENPVFEIASSVSRLQIGMATCNSCYASHSTIGDAVIRTLGGRNSTILFIPNDNNDGNSYIAFGDLKNNLWEGIKQPNGSHRWNA